ncbi:hypothetical protein T492DRAFT_845734 [Pavlovales sp. CCMP2436]|nr:hypothetical protein T492DRAFT_845734 [Pavlovales sp. CCMP2436]
MGIRGGVVSWTLAVLFIGAVAATSGALDDDADPSTVRWWSKELVTEPTDAQVFMWRTYEVIYAKLDVAVRAGHPGACLLALEHQRQVLNGVRARLNDETHHEYLRLLRAVRPEKFDNSATPVIFRRTAASFQARVVRVFGRLENIAKKSWKKQARNNAIAIARSDDEADEGKALSPGRRVLRASQPQVVREIFDYGKHLSFSGAFDER